MEKNYAFEIVPENFNSPMLSAYIEDAFLHTITPVSFTAATVVQFSVSPDTASANADRFRIVFYTNGPLPVNFTSIKAYEKNTGIQVDWIVATETNIDHYEVEKSLDGRVFNKLAEVPAKANNNTLVSYNSFDANPYLGNNFYRIKAVEKSGGIKYSGVVNVKTGSYKSSIVVYPNPVKNGMLYMKLNNQPNGKYVVQLLNTLGQQIFTQTIDHIGGTAILSLNVSSVISKGVYQLKIIHGKTRQIQQLVIQ
jgi:hypothetical protein